MLVRRILLALSLAALPAATALAGDPLDARLMVVMNDHVAEPTRLMRSLSKSAGFKLAVSEQVDAHTLHLNARSLYDTKELYHAVEGLRANGQVNRVEVIGLSRSDD